MNIKRFTAPTSREALAKARMAFGEGTLILSNRPTANGVEVVATAEDTLSALDGSAGASSNPPLLAPTPARSAPMDIPPEPPRRRQEAASAHLAQSNNNQQSVMNELHAMRELIEDRFNTMAWLGQARQNPIQSNLMLNMIPASYSPSLAR